MYILYCIILYYTRLTIIFFALIYKLWVDLYHKGRIVVVVVAVVDSDDDLCGKSLLRPQVSTLEAGRAEDEVGVARTLSLIRQRGVRNNEPPLRIGRRNSKRICWKISFC